MTSSLASYDQTSGRSSSLQAMVQPYRCVGIRADGLIVVYLETALWLRDTMSISQFV